MFPIGFWNGYKFNIIGSGSIMGAVTWLGALLVAKQGTVGMDDVSLASPTHQRCAFAPSMLDARCEGGRPVRL